VRFPGFVGPSYTLQSVNVDAQRCVNWFPELNALGTGKEREVASLVPTPGLLLKLTLSGSPVRGLYTASNGTLFAVGGQTLYSISSSWVATSIGSLSTSSGYVSMSDNGTHLVVVDGTSAGKVYNLNTAVFSSISDPDFLSADQVTFQDGYFVFNKTNSQIFFISAINDGTSYDALDIATAEGRPDLAVGVLSHQQKLYVFGKQSIEGYYDSGDTFPFTRIDGSVVNVGCSAAFSIQALQEHVYWLGGDDTGSGIVYRSSGGIPERISTPAIESIIRSIDPTTLSSARAFTYQQGGHTFYCLNLPTINSTWCYDASTGFWHERCYRNLWSLERHRADCHAVAYGKNIVGDYSTGAIYELDQNTYTDNGTPIVTLRSSPHFSDGLTNIFHQSIQIDMETGIGLDGSGQGSDPVILIRWSNDGAHSWSNYYEMSIGKLGNFRTRAIRRRLGVARDRVYEISCSEPIKRVIVGVELQVEKGAA
jgi:hypothetical protein